MIVEDDFGISSSLRELFESDGYQVKVAENGKVALELLKDQILPGLIFLDIAMPIMDGKTFLKELQEQLPKLFAKIPIFVMTAAVENPLVFNATGFLKKPFNIDEISKIAALYCT